MLVPAGTDVNPGDFTPQQYENVGYLIAAGG
jgi:hypothetical protein